MSWVRCIFSDEERTREISVDLLMDAGKRIAPVFNYYGVVEYLDEGSKYPAIFIQDGDSIDYGSSHDEKERFGTMRIHGRQIIEGATFEFDDFCGACDLIVKSIRQHSADSW